MAWSNRVELGPRSEPGIRLSRPTVLKGDKINGINRTQIDYGHAYINFPTRQLLVTAASIFTYNATMHSMQSVAQTQ